MKCLERNKTKIKICSFLSKDEILDSNGYETGEFNISYSVPEELKACVSTGKGRVGIELFGTNLVYDKTITIDDTSVSIDENTLFFIDVEPEYNNETHQVMNSDYIVKGIAKSLNVMVVAVAKGE